MRALSWSDPKPSRGGGCEAACAQGRQKQQQKQLSQKQQPYPSHVRQSGAGPATDSPSAAGGGELVCGGSPGEALLGLSAAGRGGIGARTAAGGQARQRMVRTVWWGHRAAALQVGSRAATLGPPRPSRPTCTSTQRKPGRRGSGSHWASVPPPRPADSGHPLQ